MLAFRFRHLLLTVLCTLFAVPATAGQYILVAKEVPQTERQVVETVSPGAVVEVFAKKGEQVLICSICDGWVDPSSLLPLDEASEAHFTKLIEANPKDAFAYSCRGVIRAKLGMSWHLRTSPRPSRLSGAARIMSTGRFTGRHGMPAKPLKITHGRSDLSPRKYYQLRALCYIMNGEDLRCALDCTAGLALNDNLSDLYALRGNAFNMLGFEEKARKEYDLALKKDPEAITSLIDRAFFLAGSEEDEFRNGAQAVKDALKACELCDYQYCFAVESLAAAYSEIGDFDKAVETQQRVVELVPEERGEVIRHTRDRRR